ncbi:MAG: AmmeMemoRadiSam system protein A [Actinocatenispora sp.]
MTAEPDPTDPITAAEGRELTRLAAGTVRDRLVGVESPTPPPVLPVLLAPGASFVTLTRRGRLLGCIGSLEPVRPLHLDVARNAARAMRDPRMPPVSAADWPELDISVAVLTPPEPLAVRDRDALLAALRPGVDGVLVTDGTHRATFLPAVWQKLPEPARFLDQLLVKGGWPAGGWPADTRVSRYRTLEFKDPAPRGPLPTS